MTATKKVDQHKGSYGVEMGRHSLIPDCCILYWITRYLPTIRTGGYTTYYKQLQTKRSFGYIPCPECFRLDKRVRIHTCSKQCMKWFTEHGFEEYAERLTKMWRRR